MGQKASTPANSGQQSPRSRTFSCSSTGAADLSPSNSAVPSRSGDSGQSFSFLRSLQLHQNATSVDRQRARSLSSVPDMQQQQQQHTQQLQQGSASYNHSSSNSAYIHPAVSVSSVSANSNSNSFSNNAAPYAVTTNNNSLTAHSYGNQPLGDPIHVSVPFGSDPLHGHSLFFDDIGMETRAANYAQHSTDALNFVDLQDMSMSGANIVETIALAASISPASANSLGRAYTATSLPSSIWSFNGIKCPVCNKFAMPDDIECHLVMCLTKPRLTYNEDVLSDAKGECVICLEDLSPGDTIARLPCLCIYHKGCIDRWFEVNRSCPEHPGD